jgi:RNA polymerase sigma-70 factor, ECF subfamily
MLAPQIAYRLVDIMTCLGTVVLHQPACGRSGERKCTLKNERRQRANLRPDRAPLCGDCIGELQSQDAQAARPVGPARSFAGGAPAAAASGRPPTIREVFRDHAARVYGLARLLLGHDADAEDVTQDVFLQVVCKLHTFRGEAALTTWLHRVTVNAVLMLRRQRANLKEQLMADPDAHPSACLTHAGPGRRRSVPPDEQVRIQEERQLIARAVARLPQAYQDVFVLADVEGLPNAEVAELLGLSVPAVKSRLHRARLGLREALVPYFVPDRA